jgi:hypothetical protein
MEPVHTGSIQVRPSRRRFAGAILSLLMAGFVDASGARGATIFPFGTFTESPNPPSPSIEYVGDSGNLSSILGTTDFAGLAGSFAFNSLAVSGLPSTFSTPVNAHLRFMAVTAPGGLEASINGSTGAVSQSFNNLSVAYVLTITRDLDQAVILQLSGFTGTFTGTLGQSTGTFTGQMTLIPGVNETSAVGLTLGTGTLSFTMDLTNFSSPLSVDTSDASPNVLNPFTADDPTSLSSTGSVSFGITSVPEPGSLRLLALGLASVAGVVRWRITTRPEKAASDDWKCV